MPAVSKWSNYQQKNLRKRGKKKRVLVLSGFSLGSVLLVLLVFSLAKVAFSSRVETPATIDGETETTPNAKPVVVLDNTASDQLIRALAQVPTGKEDVLEIDGKRTTLDPKLQRLAHQLLGESRPLLGAVVVTDAHNGSILAMAEYVSRSRKYDAFLPLSSDFPAASVFKIVTAAAALETGSVNSETPLRIVGNPYRVSEQKLSDRQLRRGRIVSLEYALAKSYNMAFADLTQRFLSHNELLDAARQFGFNRNLPFAMTVSQSQAAFSEEPYLFAKDSTGLSENSLSPLHAAVIASTFANGGVGLAPTLFADDSPRPFIKISPALSQKLSEMMEKTLTVGTSHRSFRGMSRHPILKNAILGGKTGSLSCKNFQGDCDWFMGFGKYQGKRIGLSVIMVHSPYWNKKSSYLARKIFETALNPETQVAAL